MKTKERIILATLDLAAEHGLKSHSMSQIAEAVGIKKPSLYNHFDSKETLIIYPRAIQGVCSDRPTGLWRQVCLRNFEFIRAGLLSDGYE